MGRESDATERTSYRLRRRDVLQTLGLLGASLTGVESLSGEARASVPEYEDYGGWITKHHNYGQYQIEAGSTVQSTIYCQSVHFLNYLNAEWVPYGNPENRAKGCWNHTFLLSSLSGSVIEGSTETNPYPAFSKTKVSVEAEDNDDAVAVAARRDSDLYGFVPKGTVADTLGATSKDGTRTLQEFLTTEPDQYEAGDLEDLRARLYRDEQFEENVMTTAKEALGLIIGRYVGDRAGVAFDLLDIASDVVNEFSHDDDPIQFQHGFGNQYSLGDEKGAGTGHYLMFDVYVAPGADASFVVGSEYSGSAHPGDLQESFSNPDPGVQFQPKPQWEVSVPGLPKPGDPNAPNVHHETLFSADPKPPRTGSETNVPVHLWQKGQPKATFTTNPSPPIPEESTTFDGTDSVDPDGRIVGYDWEIRQLSPRVRKLSHGVTGASGTHTFEEPGTYAVTLTVEDEEGAFNDVRKRFNVTQPPVAEFSVDPRPTGNGLETALDASASRDPDGDDEALSYSWSIRQVSPRVRDVLHEVEGESGTWTPEKPGEYRIELTVTDEVGAETVTAEIVTVRDVVEPEVSVTATPSNVRPGQQVALDATATDPDGGSVVDLEWNVSSASRSFITKAFDEPGVHDVEVTATDDEGQTATATTEVFVETKPVAELSMVPSDPEPGDSVSFDASTSRDPDGGGLSYSWENVWGTGPTTQKRFYSEGEQSVTVTVTDDEGESDSATVDFYVGNRSPSAELAATPSTIEPGEEVALDLDTTDVDGYITDIDWNVSSSSRTFLTKRFSEVGDHTVRVTVTDDDGATATATATVTVESNDDPVALLNADDTTVTIGQTVDLDASWSYDPDGYIQSYDWFNASGSGSSATATFYSTGQRQVSVEVTDDDGATDEASVTIDVGQANDAPTARLSASTTSAKIGETVTFDASGSYDSDGYIRSYSWSGADGYRSSASETFYSPGPKTVTVEVTDDEGATDTASVTVDVSYTS